MQFILHKRIAALQNVHYLYFTAVLFVIDMALMYIIMKVRPRETDFELEDIGAVDLTPWKRGGAISAAVLAVMVLAYIVFSPIGVGA